MTAGLVLLRRFTPTEIGHIPSFWVHGQREIFASHNTRQDFMGNKNNHRGPNWRNKGGNRLHLGFAFDSHNTINSFMAPLFRV